MAPSQSTPPPLIRSPDVGTPFPHIHFQSIGSTNRHAEDQIAAGSLTPDHGPTLIIADEQTGGIGRFGRPWSSPRGGLWCTLAWPAPGDPQAILDGLGLRVGVACTEFVESLLSTAPAGSSCRVRLKWPNDVLIDGRKVLGVLTTIVHAAPVSWILVGVGLNANFPVEDLPPELRAAATTLLATTGIPIDITGAADALADRLAGALEARGVDETLLARAQARLHGLGQAARVTLPTPGGEKVVATLIGLDASGSAVFEQDGSRWVAPVGSAIESA